MASEPREAGPPANGISPEALRQAERFIEAEEGAGKISWDSALALALMGAKAGDSVETEHGVVRVVTITY